MMFVDTNVAMYAVGRSHPLRDEARRFFEDAIQGNAPRLCTSAGVLQELMHAYLPVKRIDTLDSALTLVAACVQEVWSVGEDDVRFARTLADTHPELGARDLLHLACCRRRNVGRVKTFDRAFEAAFENK